MNPVKIILGLIPFALYALLSTVIPVGGAALAGAVAALVVALADIRRGVKAVPVVGVVVMGAFAILGFVASEQVQHLLADYGRGLATLVLAAFILVTAWFAPFTAAYARETVSKQFWGSARFVAVNRRLSLAWGLTVLVMAVGHLAASGLAVAGAAVPPLPFILNWGLPIVAIILTVRYTRQVAGSASESPSQAAQA